MIKFDNRVNWLKFIVFFVVLIISIQLLNLQIFKHNYYLDLARAKQVKSLILPAKRGQIFMKNGEEITPVVMNETVWLVFIDPNWIDKQAKSVEVAKKIREIIPSDQLLDLETKISQTKTRYQIIARNVNRHLAEKLKEADITGLGFTPFSRRVYPEGKLGSQILGFVNQEGNGQYGLEQKMNKRLTGQDGYLKATTDIANVPLTIGEEFINQAPIDGDNLVLSIDRNIQYQAEKILANGMKKTEAKEGSLLIMNPQNGQVMAMANLPDFEPDNYAKTKDSAVFNNNIISKPYEAGSVMKTFTVATGLDQKIFSPNNYYLNSDCVYIYDRKICNVVKGLNGSITFQTALNNSLNTGMIEIAKRLGNNQINRTARDKLYDYLYNRYRLGFATGVELPEIIGDIIPPTEIQGNAVRYSNMTFGQGFTANMLQIGAGFSAIINGGKYYQPTVIDGIIETGAIKKQAPKIVNQQVISADASNQARQMIVTARQGFFGKYDKKGFTVGGKTGTSETLVDGKYNAQKTIASYLGFGGGDKPEYVIMVRLEHSDKISLSGTDHAAPVFTDMSNWLIDYLKILPRK